MTAILDQLASIREGSLTPVFGLLIDTALKGSILIVAAAIAAYLLRGRSASARHAAWTAAVVGHLALPMLTLLVPQWRIPMFPAPPWLDAAPVVTPSVAAVAPDQSPPPIALAPQSEPVAGAPTSAPSAPSVSTSTWPGISILGLLWLLGSALVLLRLAIGTWRVGRLAKHGDRVDDGEWLSLTQRLANRLGITRPLTLLRGGTLAVPVTWGVVYPSVLLPNDSSEWPEARRRFVLVHEMAHVKRFDALTQLVAQITIAMLWFNPFIWLAAQRMRVEREHACDDYVLRDGTVPSLYAGELLEMVQSIGTPKHDRAAPAFAALAMARRSEFEGRMLAILDSRQNRHTLGRRNTIFASVALALLILPLAALRPFENSSPPSTARVASGSSEAQPPPQGSGNSSVTPGISDTACDSVMRSGTMGSWTHIHVANADEPQRRIIEFLSYTPGRCAQAVVTGSAMFTDDRLLTLPGGAYASFREITGSTSRAVEIVPAGGGLLTYSATLNGAPVPYDDPMRLWLARVMAEALKETAIDAPQRVTRWQAVGGGGLREVLSQIGRIRSPASKRAHYEALLDGKPLTEPEYDAVRSHAARHLSKQATDLDAVLTRLASSPASGVNSLGAAIDKIAPAQVAMGNALRAQLQASGSSTDSAHLLTQYASTDDPEMILMALHGAKELSSDTDRRVLLQTIAARALGRRNAVLRKGFFDATTAMTSDTDLRVTLTSALPYGHNDPEVTLAVFKSVAAHMTSDMDKRVTLTVAVEQKLLKNAAIRDAFMAAARTIQSSNDFTTLMRQLSSSDK